MGYSRLLPLQSLKKYQHARSSHSQLYAIWPLEMYWRPQVLKGCSSVNWNCCAGDEVTSGQTDGDWMNIVQYCPLTAQYCARRTADCSVLRCSVHWLLNIVQYCPLTAQYCARRTTDCSILQKKNLHWLLNTAQYCPLTAQCFVQFYNLVSIVQYCCPYMGAFKIRIFRHLVNFQCPTKDYPTLYYILSL